MLRGRRGAAVMASGALAATALGGVGLLGGCALPSQRLPMQLLYDDSGCPATQAPVLLVLLPGVYMQPEELQQHGFVQALRRRKLAVDVLIADANIGYVQDGSLRDRLQHEVIGAARGWGYRRIWLAGISLGGFVALAYAMQQPGEIEGIVALAPYLGRPALVQAIVDAGGPLAWRRTAQPPDAGDVETAVWRWLCDGVAGPRAGAPTLWLGFGRDDRLAAAHRALATLLPTSEVSVLPGGHDWQPWEALWAQWLDRGVLRGPCAA